MLFAIRPILELAAPTRLPPYLNPLDGTIFRPESRGGYDYEVLSDLSPDATQEGEEPILPDRLKTLLEIPDSLKARFRDLALNQVQKLPETGTEALTARRGPWKRTSAILANSVIPWR